MSRLLDDSELRTSMGRRGRELVERSFTWPIAAEQMINLYERILTEHRGTRLTVDGRVSQIPDESRIFGGQMKLPLFADDACYTRATAVPLKLSSTWLIWKEVPALLSR